MIKIKGGPIAMNQGGFGPDDYVLKPTEGGRWVRVIRRTGRHFVDRQSAIADIEAWAEIARRISDHMCVADSARVYERRRDTIRTVNASEFLQTITDTESKTER
jgi:hypothetical protein